MSGPKRPHDKVAVADMQKDFKECLNNKVGFKGFGLSEEKQKSESVMEYEGENFTLKHGKFDDDRGGAQLVLMIQTNPLLFRDLLMLYFLVRFGCHSSNHELYQYQ